MDKKSLSNKGLVFIIYKESQNSALKKSNEKTCKGTHFPHSSEVNNPPAKAGDTGLILGPGRSHMSWGNKVHVP